MSATVDKGLVEARKLEIALQRAPLELQKLEAEVNEIRARVHVSTHTAWLERFKVYPAYFTVAVSLGLAVITFLQYQAQVDRDQRFKVSVEMVDLIRKMDDGEPSQQASAALALALYGRQAVPILVESLGVDRKPAVQEAIARALVLVVESGQADDDAGYVIRRLAGSAPAFVEREFRKKQPILAIPSGVVHALGTVGAESAVLGKLSVEGRGSLVAVLKKAREWLQDSGLPTVDRKLLDEDIGRQLKRLSG